MNALLLAAGKGTRLRPLTEHTPKCLVKIGSRVLLDIWLSNLSKAGIDRFLINTHHLADIVTDYIATHPLKKVVKIVFEPELLGTAGTLIANKEFCSQDTTLIAHADNLCLCEWNEFFEAHAKRPSSTIMTMMTFRTPTPQTCGIAQLDSKGVVERFYEKSANPPGDLANAAIYLVEPSVMKILLSSSPPMTDISTELIPKLLGRINTWENTGTVIDIGTPESLRRASLL
jgi:mannose-1-phosphate guanylyltransferase